MIRRILMITAVLATAASTANASLVWNYFSTDGTTTIEGKLETTGVSGDQLVPGTTLTLVSINNVVLNGTPLTAADWATLGPFGSPPPFTTNVEGTLDVTVPGVAAVSSPTLTVTASDPSGFNRVILADPASGDNSTVVFNNVLAPHATFAPTATTFTFFGVNSIPEPATTLVFGLVGVGMLVSRRQRS